MEGSGRRGTVGGSLQFVIDAVHEPVGDGRAGEWPGPAIVQPALRHLRLEPVAQPEPPAMRYISDTILGTHFYFTTRIACAGILRKKIKVH